MSDVENDDYEDLMHADQEIENLIERAKFGRLITNAAASPGSPFGWLLDTLRQGFIETVKEFIQIDVTAPNGPLLVIQCQQKALLYMEQVQKVTKKAEEGLDAEQDVKKRRAEEKEQGELEELYGSERQGTA